MDDFYENIKGLNLHGLKGTYYRLRMHYEHTNEIIKTVSELYQTQDEANLKIAIAILNETKKERRNGDRGKY